MAIWDCDSNASPGPDGFTFAFYKKIWHLELMDMLKELHRFGKIVKGANPSFITLRKFLSLIGSMYKIIVKILACRLSKVMDQIIDDSQSTFIKGRNILDGMVILNEAIDESKRYKRPSCFFKVDFAKAFDSVNWNFLDDMMKKLNFSGKWRNWIRECVSSVLVNGSPSDEFKLQRGLRQGDPLSPFLFLIVAKGLNILTKRAVELKLLEPIEIGHRSIKVPILQYADDTIFMCSGDAKNMQVMKGLLRLFEFMSGLKVNFQKSKLFACYLEDERIGSFEQVLNCAMEPLPIQYLGMKLGGLHGREVFWNDLIIKVRNRINQWDGRHISLACRATLVQSVLSAMPIYYLSFFLLPKSVIKKLTSL
ncbi:hypothetical protein ACS0TY_010647 [Phlomoides rotata]